MLFNSVSFALFLPLVFFLHWFVASKSFRMQNVLFLIASYFFYACWDWRFLFLLVFSTLLDFFTGQQISDSRSQRSKKWWFWMSISINFGFLAVFKYYNFFVESFAEAAALLGWKTDPWTLNLILPVGISFYTFHGVSYVIDVYKGKIKAERNFIDYSVFVSFFPLLVAGPIERATHLLPQLKQKRSFDERKAIDGLKQILWGLFKKVVIADQCAGYANLMFNHTDDYSGISLIIGTVFFAFQIYGDFSGYSDIAIGTAKLFGIDLLKNFNFPYFSRNIAEFWRRWHISLSSWFRDYLYIPLGGSQVGNGKKIRNVLIIFIISGFWHGANWTFIIWGLLNAICILPSVLWKTHRKNLEIVAKGRFFPNLSELFSMILTFSLCCLIWIFFRAENLSHAFIYLSRIFSGNASHLASLIDDKFLVCSSLVLIFIFLEWIGREQEYAFQKLGSGWMRPFRWTMYYVMLTAIFYFSGSPQKFIYFQF